MKTPISAPQNLWFDAENVDDLDLTLEQNYNNLIQAGIKNNHFGSGVLENSLLPNILFNSALVNGLLDGKAISVQSQPSDPNNGNQIQVNLSGSLAAGNRTVKVLIIGLDFQNNLQYDALTFHTNETQVTSKHYTTILTLFFNDFIGSQVQSLNLGGSIVISEVSQFTLSRDCIMAAQDTQPNLFFRDFFVSSGGTLANALALALPSYNISNLNITTGYSQLRSLVENDVSSQIGQKFLATTNNIQKITLLMSVVNTTIPPFTDLEWTGDLIVSLYPLQTTVSCSTDLAPNSAIDFDPSNIPLVQLSLNYSSLMQQGIELGNIPQPVDFVFSNTSVGSGLAISAGNYYAITVKRAGSADTCQIQFAVGVNSSSNTLETLFNGTTWTDVTSESLWFQVWTDAAKVSDGQAYDNGNGMIIPKTTIDPTTQLTIDYSLGQIQFTRNDIYYALAQATIQDSAPVQDELTGNNVDSNQQFVPTITLLNQAGLSNIQNVSNPLIIGTVSDENIKSSNTTVLSYNFHEYGIVKNDIVIKVITDTTDGYRYDPSIIELVSELVEGNLIGATITTDLANPSIAYRIVKGELITMTYGDVNGDGIVDQADLLAIQSLMGYNLNYMPTYDQYITDTNYFVNATSISWSAINISTSVVEGSGSDGYIIVDPLNGTIATFGSDSANFTSILSTGSCNLVISGQPIISNNGTFSIIGQLNNNATTIQKQFYTSDVILQVLRSDIDGDMVITSNDGYLISNYVTLAPPFPATSSPANKIGTQFQAIRLTVEELVDRNDDYPNTATNRASTLHPLPDIFLDGYGVFAGQDLTTTPISFSIVRQLNWEDYSVESNSMPRLVPVAFTYQSGGIPSQNPNLGITYQSFPQQPAFDPGRNDIFIPNNLVMNNGSQLTNPDGYYYKVDFETSSIIFEIPAINFITERTVNILTDFVANYTGTGFTRIGYPAMQFADSTLVELNAISNNQLRFSIAVQSFSPQLNGIDGYCIDGIIVDGKMGVSFDGQSGLLTLNFANLYQDPVLRTLNTKIQITVFMKKAGFNNRPIFIDSTKTQNLLGIPTPPMPAISCPAPTNIIIA
jgi:hypothetical protein